MQLSHESYRVRWLVLVTAWSLAAFTLFHQAALVRDYLGIVGQLGLRGAPVAATPLQQAYPSFAADAEVWVRHALALLEGDSLQLRYTSIDNAPAGREVHWNSAWAWAIAGSGWVYHLFTGDPIAHAVEKATVWLNPTALFALILVVSSWVTRRAGVAVGVLVVAAMTCHDRIYEGFFPTYVDHHGLLTIAALGTILGGLLMGGGWWQARNPGSVGMLPDSIRAARHGAVFSALAGACGLWVSAASVIPPIAVVGIAGLVAILIQGRTAQRQGANFSGDAWRLWGRVGAGAATFFYLLEYFPGHLSFRLEPNHPFHALAWLGAGELIAQIGERWLAPAGRRWTNAKQLVWPLLVVSVAPITVFVGGTRVFSVFDPFMSRLHNDYIQEFLPLWRSLRGFNGKMIFQILVVDSLPLLAAIATLSYRRRESPIVLWFATIAAGLLTMMAWGQSRWLLNASGAQICLAIAVVASWTISYRPLVRWSAVVALMGALFIPGAVMRTLSSSEQVKLRQVSPKDANAALARDLAVTLRASQPTGDIVMLASPNASTQIGYYGRFKTLGTLYWENSAGLKAAAAILGARSETEAANLIRAHKVTHIALLAEENFIAQYYQLLHPQAADEEIKQCFGYRLFADKLVPQWLQMIPYKVPDDLRSLKPVIMLFKVNFQQNLLEAIYNVALAQIAQDSLVDAERTLDILLKQAPHVYQSWLRKGELLIARHDWNGATEHLLKGIGLAPAAERTSLYLNAAGTLYNQGQHAHAIRIYQTAMAERRSPETLCFLSWILATSKDDNLRNGKEALALAQEAARLDPNSPTILNALAGAFAEVGRFPEAIEACDRAIANAKVRGETAAMQVFQQRLALLKSGQPLRN